MSESPKRAWEVEEIEELILELKRQRERSGSLARMGELSLAIEEEMQILARLRWERGRRPPQAPTGVTPAQLTRVPRAREADPPTCTSPRR